MRCEHLDDIATAKRLTARGCCGLCGKPGGAKHPIASLALRRDAGRCCDDCYRRYVWTIDWGER
jgi:hypothetical protein